MGKQQIGFFNFHFDLGNREQLNSFNFREIKIVIDEWEIDLNLCTDLLEAIVHSIIVPHGPADPLETLNPIFAQVLLKTITP